MELMMEHVGKGIVVMLLLSMPSVLVAAGIGLVVGILQAVTQVQEQTIAAAPKILGVFLIIIILGSFTMNMLEDYFKESANIAFNIIPRDEEMVLPSSGLYEQGSKLYEDEYYGESKPQIDEVIKNPGKVPFSNPKYKQSYIKMPRDSASSPDFNESLKINSGKR